MANRTDPLAKTVHGTNPQFLIGKIVRSKIYDSAYWKEHCFGLTAASIIDRAIELTHIGGTYGGNRHATPFLCLVLKLLQIQPSHDIVVEYIKNEDFKYLRVLGAFYLRLTGSPQNVYAYLEPLLADYSKLRYRKTDGRVYLTHVDEIVDAMLRDTVVLEVDLPVLPSRHVVEETYGLPRKVSILDEELEGEGASDEASGVRGGQELYLEKKQNGDSEESFLNHEEQTANGCEERLRLKEEGKNKIGDGEENGGKNKIGDGEENGGKNTLPEAKEMGKQEIAENNAEPSDGKKDNNTKFEAEKTREGRHQENRFRATCDTREGQKDCMPHRLRRFTNRKYDTSGHRCEADVWSPMEDHHSRKRRRSFSRSQNACSVTGNARTSSSQRQRRYDWRTHPKERDERHGDARCYKKGKNDVERLVNRSLSWDSRGSARRNRRRSSPRRSESRSPNTGSSSSRYRSPYKKRSERQDHRSKSLASEDGEWSIDDGSRKYGRQSISPALVDKGKRAVVRDSVKRGRLCQSPKRGSYRGSECRRSFSSTRHYPDSRCRLSRSLERRPRNPPSQKNFDVQGRSGGRERSRKLRRFESPRSHRREDGASGSCLRSLSRSRSRLSLKRAEHRVYKGIADGVRNGVRERGHRKASSSVSPSDVPRSCRKRFSASRKSSPERSTSSDSVSRKSRSLSVPRHPVHTKRHHLSSSGSPM